MYKWRATEEQVFGWLLENYPDQKKLFEKLNFLYMAHALCNLDKELGLLKESVKHEEKDHEIVSPE